MFCWPGVISAASFTKLRLSKGRRSRPMMERSKRQEKYQAKHQEDEPAECGFCPVQVIAPVRSEPDGYAGIELSFRRGLVEAEVETEIENRVFIEPEIHAEVERIDQR